MHVIATLRRRRKRRIIHKQQSRARLIRTLLAAGVTLAMLGTGGLLAVTAIYSAITADMPSPALLPRMLNPQDGKLLEPSRIYDRTGENILQTLAPQEGPRVYMPLDPSLPNHLPQSLVDATILLMDPDFWRHAGYHLESLYNPEYHPTLAQKLVAELLLWNEPASIRRAIREQILAAQITSTYGREKILEWYLNSASYGHYAVGAEAAARLYFGKSASEMNLAEAVLLAAVGQRPAINPLDAPQAALQRQQEALQMMLASSMISTTETKNALQAHITIQPAPGQNIFAPAFMAMVLSQLDEQFDLSRVEKGGMQVITTLDYATQLQTGCALRTQLARLNGIPAQICAGAEYLPPLPPGENAPGQVSATMLAPRTGQVLALVGDYTLEKDTGTITPHRPGTLLTSFVYLTGFSRGLSPASLVWDIPPENTQAVDIAQGYDGPMPMREALLKDRLSTALQVYEQMGSALIQNTIKPFGLDTAGSDLYALLDTKNRYSVVQMAQAYGVFATQGSLTGQKMDGKLRPSALLSIRDTQGQIYADWNIPQTEQVVSAQLSYLLTDILKDNARSAGFPAAQKSGRTLDGTEIWAAEYSPHRVAVVWAGGSALHPRIASALTTAMIKFGSDNVPPDDWPLPEGILHLKVCNPSGMLPTSACPTTTDEIFIEGYQPMQKDTLFKTYSINRETGLLATVFTPQHLVEKRVFMLYPAEAQAWAASKNLPIPPTQYDTMQPQAPGPNANITSPFTSSGVAEVSGKTTIKGTAGGENFSYYRLQYGQGLYPENWTLIGSNMKQPVQQGNLLEWDTTGLRGLYVLQLMVVQTDDSLQTYTIPVSITNP